MRYIFFADKTDKIGLLQHIFDKTDLQVFDLGSPYGEEICQYLTPEAIDKKFDLQKGGKHDLTFQLWAPRHQGTPIFRKIDLNPKRCNGSTFRYATEGWGLIQLYLGGLQDNRLNSSQIGHFNEQDAVKWETTNPLNGRVNDWNWMEIQHTSRSMKEIIHNKMSVKKLGSSGILSGAESLQKAGILLD